MLLFSCPWNPTKILLRIPLKNINSKDTQNRRGDYSREDVSTHFFLKMGIDLSEMSKLTYVFARGMVTQKRWIKPDDVRMA